MIPLAAVCGLVSYAALRLGGQSAVISTGVGCAAVLAAVVLVANLGG